MTTASRITIIALVFAACDRGGAPSGAGGGGGGGAPSKGDHWYRGIVVGSSSSGAISGSLDLITFDPAYASRRKPGAPGASAGSHDVAGALYLSGGSMTLTGTYTDAGAITASGGGFTFTGIQKGSSVSGDFAGPDGAEGDFGGQDSATGDADRFCGTYTGDAGGNWNFVIAEAGALSGAFSGEADGALTGSASGSSVSITWSGQSYFGDPASGTASGTVSGGSVNGTWSGSSGGTSVQGAWQSDDSCPGPAQGPEMDQDASCPCDAGPIPASGACCDGGPYGSYCCQPIS